MTMRSLDVQPNSSRTYWISCDDIRLASLRTLNGTSILECFVALRSLYTHVCGVSHQDHSKLQVAVRMKKHRCPACRPSPCHTGPKISLTRRSCITPPGCTMRS